jgi:hypothetical protein
VLVAADVNSNRKLTCPRPNVHGLRAIWRRHEQLRPSVRRDSPDLRHTGQIRDAHQALPARIKLPNADLTRSSCRRSTMPQSRLPY